MFIKKGQNSKFETYSGFGNENENTQLTEKLKELSVEKVYVVGLALDYCV